MAWNVAIMEEQDGWEENAALVAAAPETARRLKEAEARIAELEALLKFDSDGEPVLDWVSAIVAEFERHYDPEKDDDPISMIQAKSEVRGFVQRARTAIRPNTL